MSRLTRRQRDAIELAIINLERARDFVMDSRTHVVRETTITAFPRDAWQNGEGARGIAITKDIGSNLVGLYQGITGLRQLLAVDKEQQA